LMGRSNLRTFRWKPCPELLLRIKITRFKLSQLRCFLPNSVSTQNKQLN
jgi:hypothetical protein